MPPVFAFSFALARGHNFVVTSKPPLDRLGTGKERQEIQSLIQIYSPQQSWLSLTTGMEMYFNPRQEDSNC